MCFLSFNMSINFIHTTPVPILGFGVYINSSWSGFEIDSSHIESNGADGIRYVFHDTIPDAKLDGMDVSDLCMLPITTNQIYPVRLSLEQSASLNVKKTCRKVSHKKLLFIIKNIHLTNI